MIDNYKDLPLKKFLELRDIDTEGMEDIDVQVEIIAILADMPEEEVINLPLTEYKKMVSKTAFLATQPKEMKNPPKTIKVNGREYDVVSDVRNFTTGQYIDYQSYIKDPENLEKNFDKMMSIFLIPKGKKYGNGYDIAEVVKDALDISVETVIGLSRFFFQQLQSSINNTLTYLEWMMKKLSRKEKNKEMKERMEKAREELLMLKSLVIDGDGYRG